MASAKAGALPCSDRAFMNEVEAHAFRLSAAKGTAGGGRVAANHKTGVVPRNHHGMAPVSPQPLSAGPPAPAAGSSPAPAKERSRA
jgi:hypothetical protein